MLLKGFRFGLLLQFAVGPVCLFIFQTAAAAGFLPAVTAVLAVALIDGLYILAAIGGMGTVLNRCPEAQKAFRYFGAAVLIVFGLSNLLGVFGISFLPSLNFLAGQSGSDPFRRTLILTLSNPLTILFWAGVFSARIAAADLARRDLYLFGFGAVLSTLSFLGAVALLGSCAGSFLPPAVIGALNLFVGLLLIFFGLRTVRPAPAPAEAADSL